MANVLSRCFFLVLALGLVANFGALILHAQDESKERQPAGRNAEADSQNDLGNAAKNYVERRKRAEGEAAKQRATADQARAQAQLLRQQAEQQAKDSGRTRRSELGAELTDSPKTMFAITLWAVRLNDSDKNGDESKLVLPPRTEVPTEFGSMDSVRALINGLATSGRVRSSRELRVLALDGQQAQVQVGSDKPQVTAVSVTNLGRSNALTYRSVGTVVRARAHIDSEKRIQLELDYNASEIEKAADVPMFESNDGKTKVTADMIVNQQIQTTAKMKNGAAVLLKCDTSNGSTDKTASRQTDLIILGCETVPAPE
jgi:hypothetical protein